MPELPEIQAHVERLEAEFGGAVLEGFRPLAFTALKTFDPPPDAAYGRALGGMRRRGKYLLADFDGITFVVHLMQGGRLKPDEKQAPKPRFGQARWRFTDGRALLLTEAGTERKAGVWVLAGDPEGQDPLDRLGPDADTLDVDALAGLLAANSGRLHGFLRDQRALAGLGRRLANEVCHRARLSPFANTARLDRAEVERLHEAIGACIAEGLAHERTLSAMSASADRPGAVHHRVGEPCPRCGDAIRSVEYRTYTVAYCPTCQTGGKVLADNTTSRFLK
ncbi:MAG: DNA-formamidopyrimidine glycosylase family protein [Acidimicrobiia bacterium]